jgi:CRP-like cAMP-binding protein
MNALRDIIARHPFFFGMAPEHLDIVVSGAREARFKPDEVLFRESEPANRFYLIEGGRVAVEAHLPADGSFHIQTLGPGDVLGWSWLFPPFVWHFQARALEPTRSVVLNGAHLLVKAEQNKAFGYELMKRVAQVVIRRLQATRKELLDAEVQSALTD